MNPVRVFVCVKQVLDWNASTKDFRIDPVTGQVAVSFARHCIDQFDEIALEVALQLRDRFGGVVHALTAGSADGDEVLRHAFAMKADAATLIERDGTHVSNAALLAAAISRNSDNGVVLCGRTSSDNGSGRTGPLLAEFLERPFVANVVSLERDGAAWLCRRETHGGYEVLRVTRPFVASVTNTSLNVPRAPTMKDVMQAHRAKIDVLPAASLCPSQYAAGDVREREGEQGLRVRRRYVPASSRACERLQGTPAQQAKQLAEYIRRCQLDAGDNA